MHITQSETGDQGRIEIRVSGEITAEGACALVPFILAEASGAHCREFVLDLRDAAVPHPVAVLRSQSLLQLFTPVVQERDLQVTLLCRTNGSEQWLCLDRATTCRGINLKVFASRQEALQFGTLKAAANSASLQ
ncbi:MAG: hypothetical protein RBS95_09600 [Desulfobulbus sp.]|jgi:hypothetical protein|nr:hypothetical protein [Desulfobulbus sp.]